MVRGGVAEVHLSFLSLAGSCAVKRRGVELKGRSGDGGRFAVWTSMGR